MSKHTYEELENAILDWSYSHPDVRAGLVVGSRARQDHPADEWSDLDLILFTLDPAGLASDGSWLEKFGDVWVSWLSINSRGDPEWFALYAGGLKVVIFLASIPQGNGQLVNLPGMMAALPFQDVFARGVRVLFDKSASSSNDFAQVAPSMSKQDPLPPLPTSEAFTNAVNGFLIAATRAVKLIQRGELWQAKFQCDCEMKRDLLTMLEWHTLAKNGLEHDTWYDGRFMAEWADPRVLITLPETFATYDLGDLRRALFATMEMYRWLTEETAEQLGYTYSVHADESVTEWIRSMFTDR